MRVQSGPKAPDFLNFQFLQNERKGAQGGFQGIPCVPLCRFEVSDANSEEKNCRLDGFAQIFNFFFEKN